MADKFDTWDRFARHHTLTQDPQKALRWTRYELWAEKRRMKHLEEEAEMLAAIEEAKAFSVIT